MGVRVDRVGVRLVIHVALPCPLETLEGAARLMRDLYADSTLELDWSVVNGELILRVASPLDADDA